MPTALGWTLDRLERALTTLAELLAVGPYRLVLDGRELSLTLVTDIIPENVTRALSERHLPGIALSAREARRLVELVRAHLTLSLDGVQPDPCDTELISRSMLVRDAGPHELEGWREPPVRPHPDVLFALGLGGAPRPLDSAPP